MTIGAMLLGVMTLVIHVQCLYVSALNHHVHSQSNRIVSTQSHLINCKPSTFVMMSQSASNHDDDGCHKHNYISAIARGLKSRFRLTFASFVIAFSTLRPSVAAGKATLSKDIPTKEKSTYKKKIQQPSKVKSAAINKPVNKKKIEIIVPKQVTKSIPKIEVDDDSKAIQRKQLTQLGLALTGISIVASLVGDNKSSKPKRVETGSITPEEYSSLLRNRIQNSDTSITSEYLKKLKLSKSLQSVIKVPGPNEILGDNESTDDIFAEPKATSKDTSSVEDKSEPKLKSRMRNMNLDQAPKAQAIANEVEDKVVVKASEPAAPAPPPQKKAGFFDRFFKKPGKRPTTLNEALSTSDDPSHSLRQDIFSYLLSYIPQNFVDDWEDYVPRNKASSDDDKIALLKRKIEDSDLTIQDAAEGFADVTNAMLVKLVDTAIDFLNKDKNATIDTLNVISDFVGGAGSLFSKSLSQATIEPVQYNGNANKGKLESLYYEFAKVSLTLNTFMNVASKKPSDVDESESNEENVNLEKLGRIQQVLAIKDNKREGIEQKVVRELVMSAAMNPGALDMGGFADLFGADGGVNAEEILKNIQAAGGGAPGDGSIPDFANMDPEEISRASQDAIREVSHYHVKCACFYSNRVDQGSPRARPSQEGRRRGIGESDGHRRDSAGRCIKVRKGRQEEVGGARPRLSLRP